MKSGSALVLQVVAIFVGGGVLQLFMFLLRRRSEITALDKSSTAPLLASANELIVRLESSEAKLYARVETLEKRLITEQAASTDVLAISHGENRRLVREVAELRVDLDVCEARIHRLRQMLPANQTTTTTDLPGGTP